MSGCAHLCDLPHTYMGSSGGVVEWWSGGEMTSEARYTCDYILQVNCLYLRNANII